MFKYFAPVVPFSNNYNSNNAATLDLIKMSSEIPKEHRIKRECSKEGCQKKFDKGDETNVKIRGRDDPPTYTYFHAECYSSKGIQKLHHFICESF